MRLRADPHSPSDSRVQRLAQTRRHRPPRERWEEARGGRRPQRTMEAQSPDDAGQTTGRRSRRAGRDEGGRGTTKKTCVLSCGGGPAASRLFTRLQPLFRTDCAVNRAATNSSQDPPVLGCCQQPTNSPASGASRRLAEELGPNWRCERRLNRCFGGHVAPPALLHWWDRVDSAMARDSSIHDRLALPH